MNTTSTEIISLAVKFLGPPAHATPQIKDLKGFLDPNDGVAISFWIISIAMVAATVFFLMEASTAAWQWKTSLNVGALVTLVAGVHYFYMREFWVQMHASPILYRYIDWSITVPLQMVEFYLILSAVKPDIGQAMCWRLMLGTVMMLAFGYFGETAPFPSASIIGFVLGMAGWFFILLEIFGLDELVAKIGVKGAILVHLQNLEKKIGLGEAGSVAASGLGDANEHVKKAYSSMRIIVTVGWSIYPLGYVFGYLLGAVNADILNLVYNLADFVNKIAFCLAIWTSAKAATLAAKV